MAVNDQFAGYAQQGLLAEPIDASPLGDFGRGLQYSPFDLLGAPVDLVNMGLQGIDALYGARNVLGSEQPFLGSEYLIDKYADLGEATGLFDYQRPTGSIPETVGRITGGVLAPTGGAATLGRGVDLLETGMSAYAAGAPARVAERARTTTLGSGIDPTAIVDDMIVARQGGVAGPGIDELGFVSQALETAKGLQQPKGSGEQYRSMLLKGGVKPDEIAFTPGLEGLLSQPRVTRDELVGLLEQNRISLDEYVSAGGDPDASAMAFPDRPQILSREEAYGAEFVDDEIRDILAYDFDDVAAVVESENPGVYVDASGDQRMRRVRDALLVDDTFEELPVRVQEDFYNAAKSLAEERYSYDPLTRLQDPETGYEIVGNDQGGYYVKDEGGALIDGYQIGEPGVFSSLSEARIQAENNAIDRGLVSYAGGEARYFEYTEDGGKNYQEIRLTAPRFEGRGEFFQGDHFDEPNIVVHARTKDRTMAKDAGGVLYVEELQSDWGQQGRATGFSKPDDQRELVDLERQIEPFAESMYKANEKMISMREDALNELASSLGLSRAEAEVRPEFYQYGRMVYPNGETAIGSADLLEIINGKKGALRKMAGEPGSFSTKKMLGPEVLPDDYRVAVEDFTFAQNNFDPRRLEIEDIEGRMAPAPFVTGSDKFTEVGIKRLLAKAVQEDKKYLSFSPGEVQYERWGEEGLETFYDKIIPKVAKKVAKKLDPEAQVGNMEVRMDGVADKASRLTIEITPKMRDAIKKGIPLFSAGGAGLLGVGMQDEPQPAGGIL